MPIKLTIASKSNYASRPSVPTSQKQSATEFNQVVAAVNSNYERLILNWTTDVLVNSTLAVGQYVLFSGVVYRIDTAYNVGSPITWDGTKATAVLSAHFRGYYVDLAALQAAVPVGDDGDYAFVDAGVGNDAQIYIWDDDDNDWVVASGGGITPPWDETTAGSVERSTQSEAEAITTQAAATSGTGGLSSSRTPDEVSWYHALVNLFTRAITWAAKQTFTTAPRFNSVTASRVLKVDVSKDLTSGQIGVSDWGNIAADSVIGNATGSPAAPTEITASTNDTVFARLSTGLLGFTKLVAAMFQDNTIALSRLVNSAGNQVISKLDSGSGAWIANPVENLYDGIPAVTFSRIITASTGAPDSADHSLLVDTTAAACTITLPDPSTVLNMEFVIMKIAGGNNVTIDPQTFTVNGSTTDITISTQWDWVRIKAVQLSSSPTYGYIKIGGTV